MDRFKVLIVDDDESLRFKLLHKLNKIGYEVYLASNGFEALSSTKSTASTACSPIL